MRRDDRCECDHRSPVRDVIVLCYHAVHERWPAPLSVTPEALEWQLSTLLRRGYKGVTFHQAVNGPGSGRHVAVTFDDAYLAVLEVAAPILSRLGLPATVFVPTRYPDRPDEPMAWPGIDRWVHGPYREQLRPMSWRQLEALAERGWEVGSHTRSHPRLTTLGDDALRDELEGSKLDCERALGRPCHSLAYPYGDHDPRVVAAASDAGYASAGTLPGRLRQGGPLEWPRVGVYQADGGWRFRLKVSPAVRRLRASALWPR